jgi:predicted metalloprotease with PDZ domain
VSYYTKGQVLGVLLDVLIRDRTDNQRSLDDLMRTMNVDFARQGKTYRDSLDVRLTAEKVAGGNFEEFFGKYVSGTEPFPYQQALRLAGWDLREIEHKRPVLGFFAERDSTGTLVVRGVDSESSAASAGLRVGDVIQKWNGSEPPQSLVRWLYSQRLGNTLQLNVTRDEGSIALTLKLDEITETLYRVNDQSRAPEKAKRIREGILRAVTQPVTAAVH